MWSYNELVQVVTSIFASWQLREAPEPLSTGEAFVGSEDTFIWNSNPKKTLFLQIAA